MKSDIISKKRLCTFVHKCLYSNQLNDNFSDYFAFKKSTVNTRSNGTKLVIPRIKLESARKSTYYQGAIVFNDLPKDIRLEIDFETFKKSLNRIL